MALRQRWKNSLLIIFLLMLMLSGCGTKEPVTVEVPEIEELPDPYEEDVYLAYCPLDGQGLEKIPQVRPIAVMLGNNPSARPQYGMAEADLIYEFPAEGGITRFMAVYYHNQAAKVGPVRSARPYFVDRALDWDGVYVHVGQSPQTQVYFKNNKVAHIDEFSNGKFFWRDRNRKAPDNLFTSTELLRERMVELNYEQPRELEFLQFALDAVAGKGETVHKLEIYYPEKMNRAMFQYNSEDNIYQRYTGGKPHLDGETNEQLQAKNIIIQHVDTKVLDNEGRLEVKMFGQGKIQLFSSGRVVEGIWEKKELRQPTYFYDLDGNILTINPGQTWIQIVDKRTKVVTSPQ